MSRRRMRVPAVLAFVIACAVGAMGMILFQHSRAPEQLEGLRVTQSSRDLVTVASPGELEVRAGAVTLFDEASAVQLRVDHPVRLRREARGMRVVSGTIEFQVGKRSALTPTRMLVSHGEIEVHGTRFQVRQRSDGGEVTLYEGSILFRCSDGREVDVKPGETLQWPLPPAPPPTPAGEEERGSPLAPQNPAEDRISPRAVLGAVDDQPLAPAPLKPIPGADWSTHDRLRRAALLLERIPKLRSQGKDAQAIAELEVAMKQDLPMAARERLSFDLGELLSWDEKPDRACRHWKDHTWRYPAGKYDEQVKASQRELHCR